MKANPRERSLRSLVGAGIAVIGIGLPVTAMAQNISDLQIPRSPLVLKGQGSFFVGGENTLQTPTQLGNTAEGHVTNNQLYVRYMLPTGKTGVPVVLIHGGGLSGKSYETTPDGRMGWDEYFVRKGHPTYVPDQASRARAGFNQAVFNDVRAGVVPPSALPIVGRTSDELAWAAFRWGPSFGVPFADTQFPVKAAAEFSKQGIPGLNALLPAPDPNFAELSDLAAKVGGAVLLGHSQSGGMPFNAALSNPTGVKGMIMIESGCSSSYTDAQITTLAKIPTLILFGDHLDSPNPFPFPALFEGCKQFVSRLSAAGGNATALQLSQAGLRGNSHMMMIDKNNLQVADLILKWIDKNVKYKATRTSGGR